MGDGGVTDSLVWDADMNSDEDDSSRDLQRDANSSRLISEQHPGAQMTGDSGLIHCPLSD